MALASLVATNGQIVRLWQKSEPAEIAAIRAHAADRFQRYGLYKVDGLQVTEARSALNYRWKVYCHGYLIAAYATEAEADTFIRKLHDQINSTDGSGTIKRMADL